MSSMKRIIFSEHAVDKSAGGDLAKRSRFTVSAAFTNQFLLNEAARPCSNNFCGSSLPYSSIILATRPVQPVW